VTAGAQEESPGFGKPQAPSPFSGGEVQPAAIWYFGTFPYKTRRAIGFWTPVVWSNAHLNQ